MELSRSIKRVNIILFSIVGLIFILTATYWIYYEFISGRVISISHSHLRQFIFWYGLREISFLTILICSILSLISLKWGNNKKTLFMSIIVLILEFILLNQLQISNSP